MYCIVLAIKIYFLTETMRVPDFLGLSVLVLLLALSRFVLEVIELFIGGLVYFLSLTNWIEISQAAFTLMFVFFYYNDNFCVSFRQWQVGVSAVFLGWIDMILLVSRLPVVGSYVVILIRIVKTFTKLLVLAILLVVAFGLTFYMVFFDVGVMVSCSLKFCFKIRKLKFLIFFSCLFSFTCSVLHSLTFPAHF